MVQSFFHWEAIIYLQKLSLCILAVFCSSSMVELQLPIALMMMIFFALLSQLNNPYHSETLNRLSFLSYCAGVVYLLGRLSMRGLGPTETQLEAENVGIVTCGPVSDDLLSASNAYWDPDQSEDHLKVAVWTTVGLIVAIESYFVWRLYLLCLGSLSKRPKC